MTLGRIGRGSVNSSLALAALTSSLSLSGVPLTPVAIMDADGASRMDCYSRTEFLFGDEIILAFWADEKFSYGFATDKFEATSNF